MTNPTVAYVPGSVRLLDQTRLPHEEQVLDCRTIDELVDAIRRLVVRGAPAIGDAGLPAVETTTEEAAEETSGFGSRIPTPQAPES